MRALKYFLCLLFLGGIVAVVTIFWESQKKIKAPKVSADKSISVAETQTAASPYSGKNQQLSEDLVRCNSAIIISEIDHELPYDYDVQKSNDTVILKAKTQKTSHWLIEQYISYLSETDDCINAAHLPPSFIDFENDPFGNFDFIYREPHFSPNLEHKLHSFSGANSVEEYWDVWGHNLFRNLRNHGLGRNIFMNNNPNQICFSKPALLDNTTEYLKRRAGNSSGYDRLNTRRFVIMPLDDMTACVCSNCVKLGNTYQYATPAVLNFMDRLADRFPNYTFFTAAYHSTAKPPKQPPKHRIDGVLVSACDLPKGVALDPENVFVKEFLETTGEWKKYTDTLFVWDYAANYNDFFTPLPILYALKKNLKFYRDCGITGVFLQGSSYDYSPFDDVKTFAATALMINGRLDVDMLCRRYFARFYPVSANILADYYLSLEKAMEQGITEQGPTPYNLHGNLGNAIKSYFCVDDFLAFYQNLELLLTDEIIGDYEKKRLEKLYTALSFTRLQIAFYLQTGSHDIANTLGKTVTITPEIEAAFKQLSKYRNYGLKNYMEKDGDLKKYLDYWGNSLLRNR